MKIKPGDFSRAGILCQKFSAGKFIGVGFVKILENVSSSDFLARSALAGF
jgi:hypothetical protein